MINKIRTILSGTSLTEKEFDKCTKELCDLFNVSEMLNDDFISEQASEYAKSVSFGISREDTASEADFRNGMEKARDVISSR